MCLPYKYKFIIKGMVWLGSGIRFAEEKEEFEGQ